jgi:putative Holliday junction resolvase
MGNRAPDRQIVLAIDYGSKRLGVAVGNRITCSASPLTSLTNNRDLVAELVKLIDNWNPATLLVGYPVDSAGEPMAVCKGIDRLEARLSLPIERVNEYLSTVAARGRLAESARDVTASIRNGEVDAVSAQIICETWLLSESR